MRIVVTGGSGKAGRWIVRDLREHGHDVLSVDLTRDGRAHGPSIQADLTDLGQCHDVIGGTDAVVHLAAIPGPDLRPAGETFRTNTISTYNMFVATADRGVGRMVWASSETVLGLPFAPATPPDFAPIDETVRPRPESSYALSKLVGETMAEQFARRSGVPFVGLRISNIMEPDDYKAFRGFETDLHLRMWNLWSYVDVRDVAGAIRAALTAPVSGAEVCIVAAADTVMRRPSAELMAEVFPGVPLRRELGLRESLLSVERAGRVLGWEPEHSWLDEATD